MKIFHKLMIGFSIIAFIVALLSLINYFYYSHIETNVDLIAKSNMVALENASKSAFYIQQTENELQKLLIESLNQRTQEIDRSKQTIKAAQSALDLALSEWKQASRLHLRGSETGDSATSEQEELKKLDIYEVRLSDFHELTTRVIFLLDQESYDDAEVSIEFVLAPLSDELQNLIEQLDANKKLESIAASDEITADMKIAVRYNLYSTLFAFSIALVLGYFISKSFSQSITKLQKTTTEIGKGHLEVPIEITSDDELGQLAQSITAMAGNLKKTRHRFETWKKKLFREWRRRKSSHVPFEKKSSFSGSCTTGPKTTCR